MAPIAALTEYSSAYSPRIGITKLRKSISSVICPANTRIDSESQSSSVMSSDDRSVSSFAGATAALDDPKPERLERRDLRGDGVGFSGGDGGGDGPAAAGESLAR